MNSLWRKYKKAAKNNTPPMKSIAKDIQLFSDANNNDDDESKHLPHAAWNEAEWNRECTRINEFANIYKRVSISINKFTNVHKSISTEAAEKCKNELVELFLMQFHNRIDNEKFPLASIQELFISPPYGKEKIRDKAAFVRTYYHNSKSFLCDPEIWIETFIRQLKRYPEYKPKDGNIDKGFWVFFTAELSKRRKDKPIPLWFIKRDNNQTDETTRTHLRYLARILENCRLEAIQPGEEYNFLMNMENKVQWVKEKTKEPNGTDGAVDSIFIDYLIDCFNLAKYMSLDITNEEGEAIGIPDPKELDPYTEKASQYFSMGSPEMTHKNMVRLFTLAVSQHKGGRSSDKITALYTREAVRELADYTHKFYLMPEEYCKIVETLQNISPTEYKLETIKHILRSEKEQDAVYKPKAIFIPDLEDWIKATPEITKTKNSKESNNFNFYTPLSCEMFANGEIVNNLNLPSIVKKWELHTGTITTSDSKFIKAVMKTFIDNVNEEVLNSFNKKQPSKPKQ